ncbi:MAG: DMT family transporter [Minisyncoccia bacterium]
MTWIIYTCISIFSRAIGSIAHKVLAKEVSASGETLGFLFLTASLFLTFIAVPVFDLQIDTSFTKNEWLTLLGMALTQGIGVILYFKSLKRLSSSTAQIVFSSMLIFSTIFAIIFLDSHFTLINIVGIVTLILAITLVSRHDLHGDTSGIVLMIASAFLFAIYQVISVAVVHTFTLVTYLLATYLGAATCIALYAPRTVFAEIVYSKDQVQLLYLSLIAGATSLGNVAFAYLAYASAPEPIKVALLLTTQVVVSVILAYIFLKERDDFFAKCVSAILVVIAGYALLG